METVFDAFRNISRRWARSFFAVLGVAVGVFSFIIMGSMSEHFQKIAHHFKELFSNRIIVCEKPSFWAGGGILSESKISKVAGIEGVAEAVPVLIIRMKTDRLVLVGLPQVIVGVPPENLSSIAGNLPVISGMKKIDNGTILAGFDIANEYKLKEKGEMEIEGMRFKVEGILEKSGDITDGQIFMTLAEAQKLYDRQGLITNISVIPKPGVNPEVLSKEIKDRVGGVEVIPPEKFKAQIDNSLALWNSVIFGAAFAACAAGLLCIIIVMLFSVSERQREIGILKATGATGGYILSMIVTEAFVISIMGWLAGAAGAFIFDWSCASFFKSMGSDMFDITARLIITSLAGAIAAGSISGLIPAWKAYKISPVQALKVRW